MLEAVKAGKQAENKLETQNIDQESVTDFKKQIEEQTQRLRGLLDQAPDGYEIGNLIEATDLSDETNADFVKLLEVAAGEPAPAGIGADAQIAYLQKKITEKEYGEQLKIQEDQVKAEKDQAQKQQDDKQVLANIGLNNDAPLTNNADIKQAGRQALTQAKEGIDKAGAAIVQAQEGEQAQFNPIRQMELPYNYQSAPVTLLDAQGEQQEDIAVAMSNKIVGAVDVAVNMMQEEPKDALSVGLALGKKIVDIVMGDIFGN